MTRLRSCLLVAIPLVVLAAVLASLAGSGNHHLKAMPGSPASTTTVSSASTQGLSAQPPATAPVVQSPTQVADDQQIAQLVADSPGLSQVAGMTVPAPAIIGGWPRLQVAQDPTQWALEFVAGLEDVSYAKQTRAGLGAWLMANEAPDLLPGVPAVVQGKVLYAWLFDPGPVQGSGPPVPSASQWAANARAGVVQRVSGLLTQSDPQFASLIATGWQPSDPRTAVIDVSGQLTVAHGHTTTFEHFTVAVSVGSAAMHSGYGTSQLEEWRTS